MIPKRGGVAIMVGWIRNSDRTQTPVEGPFYILPDGSVLDQPTRNEEHKWTC